jgi:hypothetical protein
MARSAGKLNMKIKSPVIVVGVPRSGTSFVVECLMKHYGVRMSLNGFTTENDYILDDNETYEDATVVDLNIKLSDGRLHMKQYKKLMKRFFTSMQKKGEPWGFKDPRLLQGLRWVIEHFDGNLTIIRTDRDPQLVIQSMVRVLGWPEYMAVKRFNERNQTIEWSLRYKNLNVLHCRFADKRRTEEDFCATFEKALAKKQDQEAQSLEFFKRKQERRMNGS